MKTLRNPNGSDRLGPPIKIEFSDDVPFRFSVSRCPSKGSLSVHATRRATNGRDFTARVTVPEDVRFLLPGEVVPVYQVLPGEAKLVDPDTLMNHEVFKVALRQLEKVWDSADWNDPMYRATTT